MPVDYRAPNINARRLGLYLRVIREEVLKLSYDEAAAQLGCASEWLVRVETGFESPSPAEVERMMERYRVRAAMTADMVIDLASRPAGPPWLAAHVDRLKASTRDIFVLESEASVIHAYSVLWVPELVQAEPYARLLLPHQKLDCDVEVEWQLLNSRQRCPVRRRELDVIIDESAFDRLPTEPEVMRAQLRHLLDLSHHPDKTIRLVPKDALIYEDRLYPFDVLEFPEVNDRVTVVYNVLGAEFGYSDASDIWNRIEQELTIPADDSREVIRRRLAELTAS